MLFSDIKRGQRIYNVPLVREFSRLLEPAACMFKFAETVAHFTKLLKL